MTIRPLCITAAIATILACAAIRPSIAADTEQLSDSVYRTTLTDGMRLICRKEPGVPLVALQVFVRVGDGQDMPQTAGVGSFVARTLLASTSARPPDTINEEIRDLGGNVTVTREPDWTQISALTVPDRLTDAADLVTDVLKDATFDSDVVEEQRREILSDIDSGDATPFDRTYTDLRQTLYAGTGYDLPVLGTQSSIRKIMRRDLVTYYNHYFIPKNYVMVVVGDIDPESVRAMIENDMVGYDPLLRGSRRGDPVQFPVPQLTEDVPAVHASQPDLNEVCVMIGYRAPSMDSPDYPVLQVINALLGGMKTSRLFTTVREQQGLAYDLGSFYSPMIYAGDLTGYIFAAPTRFDADQNKRTATLPLIKAALQTEFQTLQTTAPTDAELARAKHFLIGSYKIKHERIEDRATLLGISEMCATDGAKLDTNYADYINAVTAADIQRVAKKYFIHPGVSVLEPAGESTDTVTE